jgi:hypothetical protein
MEGNHANARYDYRGAEKKQTPNGMSDRRRIRTRRSDSEGGMKRITSYIYIPRRRREERLGG